MEPEHGPATNGHLETCPSLKKLRSSSFTSCSSSPDSPLKDPFRDGEIEPLATTVGITASIKLDEVAEFVSDDEKDTSLCLSPNVEHPDHELPVSTLSPTSSNDTHDTSITESPPIQAMEHPEDSPYRIPSSVFQRNKSSNPTDWSMASNESLFSIHMGNMSFTKDFMFWRSGELDVHGEPSTSGQLTNFSPHPPTINEVPSLDFGEAEAAVVNAKVLTETVEDRAKKNMSLTKSTSCHSDESVGSVKSFAFPILADTEKVVSAKGINKPAQAQLQPQWSEKSEPKTPQEAPAPAPAQTSWCSCFSCCTFC